MRSAVIVACMLLGAGAPAGAQVSIGINLALYPDLVPVPGYPVYYAPQVDSNLFFYDGLYWVYAQDGWYTSSWYNGPWDMVPPELVPVFVLRVPVRYYQRPPPYFRDWSSEGPPRWGEHWGRDWEQRRGGWDHWDRASAPALAPLPTYQRQYSGDRYPRVDQQLALRNQNYHYQPRETVVRQQYQQPPGQAAPAQRRAQAERDRRSTPPPDIHRGNAPTAAEGVGAAGRPELRSPSGGQAADETRRSQAERAAAPPPGNPGVVTDRRPEQGASPHESQPPRLREQTDRVPANAPTHEPKRDPEHDRDH
jgi:hypothetical protein